MKRARCSSSADPFLNSERPYERRPRGLPSFLLFSFSFKILNKYILFTLYLKNFPLPRNHHYCQRGSMSCANIDVVEVHARRADVSHPWQGLAPWPPFGPTPFLISCNHVWLSHVHDYIMLFVWPSHRLITLSGTPVILVSYVIIILLGCLVLTLTYTITCMSRAHARNAHVSF